MVVEDDTAAAHAVSVTHAAHTAQELQPIFKNMIAGGIAGAVSRTAVAPLERTKILLQLHTSFGRSPPLSTVLRKVWREEGWRGLFRGNGTNIIRIFPYSAVQFTVYESLKQVP
jgi:solute carrier family 25 phosphate transporter 23/24/25/41